MIQADITRLSPNVNRDGNGNPLRMPSTVQTVIIHATRSGKSMNPSEFDGTLNYMATPGTTSSHWVIARDGRKARVVPDDQQAWHAGADNDNAFGIELEQGVESDGFTEVQMASLVMVCRGYVDDFGVDVWHASNSTTPGFIGHEETGQGKSYGKSDPGKLFEWDRFIAALHRSISDPPIPTWPLIDELKTQADLGHFLAQGYNLGDLVPWQKDIIRDWARRVS